MKIWGMTWGQDGTAVSLEEQPFWAWAAEQAGWWLLRKTHPVFCCPEWEPLYTVFRWGPLDEDGWSEKSLGYSLFRFGNLMAGGLGAWRKTVTVDRLRVTPDWVREHQPDAGWPYDGSADPDGEVDDGGEPGDVGSGGEDS